MLLLAGSTAEPIYVHASLLSKASEFFKIALKQEWMDKTNRAITLPDDEHEIVAAYVKFLYLGKIPSTKGCRTWLAQQKLYQYLATLYVFGEKIVDSAFQNIVMDALVATVNEAVKDKRCYPTGIVVNVIYDGTPKGSPARHRSVDACP